MHHDTRSLKRWGGGGAPLILSLWFAVLASLSGTPARAASSRVVITPSAGFTITWDGNNGGFSSPDATAGPGDNIALASNGTTPFGSSEFDGGGKHLISHINDGLYGNSHSWIANFVTPDPNPFIGLRFAASVDVSSIAWGRDNGNLVETDCGGTCTDRNVDTYTLQFTTVDAPDATTADTGDASTGWETIGTVQYLDGPNNADFSGYLRHRFDVAQSGGPIAATGLRIKVANPNTDLDEMEVNPLPDPVPPISNFIEITPNAGFSIIWDRNEGLFSTPDSPAPAPVNDASASRGAVAFGSSELNFGVHFIHNVNDGFYGNTHSWIPDFAANPDPAPFIGINFGHRILLQNIAWGRDNGDVAGDCCGGTLTDRALGLYVLQVTTVANPGVATPEACGPTPESGWVTIGTIRYKTDDLTYFNSSLRHRFDVAQGSTPILATGIRIKVPNNNSDIDEIEVNGNLAIEQKALRITNAPGMTITWDGNDGQFNDPAVGAGPPPNRALATEGTIPFTSSDLGPILSIPFHRVVNLNDGLYGNSFSWISANGVGGTSDLDPFAGLNFGGSVAITNIAWSRDNGDIAGDCCGGILVDRTIGTYRLQYTTVDAPDATTPDTGDASTGWADIGTVTYANEAPPFFTSYWRHRFDISAGGDPLDATGLRIKVPNGSIDIDEIEVNSSAIAPPPLGPVGVTASPGYAIAWDGNNGDFFDPGAGATPPPNRALASEGTTPFTSSDLGATLGIPYHRAVNLNDGIYGNSHSWISDFIAGDANPFAGLSFGASIGVTNIAWSRDNGDNIEFVGTDRDIGKYTLQVTAVPAPDATTAETEDSSTGWATVGTVEYRRANPPEFTPFLRHRFDLSSGGLPIDATGLRIKVSDGGTDIDEIEVNTPAAVGQPHITSVRSGSNLVITWTGGGGLEGAPTVFGPWTCIPDAVSGYPAPLGSGIQFFRVRR